MADEAQAAIAAQTLPHAIGTDQTAWTAYVDLLVLVGQGHRLHDTDSAYYVPPEAMRQIVYSLEQIDIAKASTIRAALGSSALDHETVIRLSAAHRLHWPEIYGAALTPRVR